MQWYLYKGVPSLHASMAQVYMGTWAGRRWFFPTVFYQNSRRQRTGWHMPEQARFPLIELQPPSHPLPGLAPPTSVWASHPQGLSQSAATMQVLQRVRMRMQRTVRVLYMIHCTFRDGFQVVMVIQCNSGVHHRCSDLTHRVLQSILMPGDVQGEVLEELQHNYPLDLLMALSEAAIGALQVRSVPWLFALFCPTPSHHM